MSSRKPTCPPGQVQRPDTLQGSQNSPVDWSAPQRLPLRILEEASMRYASISAASYCGVDLHARTMYVVVLDQHGHVRLERNLPTDPDAFLAALAPFRPDVAVACECVHSWYWLADLCADQKLPFA